MVYIRRYLSGQQATTVVIAQGAITTDKIVDKAVTQPKVGDDAITSDKIAPGAVESSDIKDGGIKSVDIASGAVTTDKIASQAVTVDKLEASIQGIARPLTPGVSSAEIAAGAVVASKIGAEAVETAKVKDGNINAAKLAADAVETVKVKDGAITTAKIAGGAVDQTKIGVDAVTGSEILNRSVGNLEIAVEGCHRENIKDLAINTAKLNPEAVTAAKLGTDSVIESKLAAAALARRHIESKEIRVIHSAEEFGGLDISNRWRKRIDPGGSILPVGKNGIKFETSAVSGEQAILDWGGEGIEPALDSKPIMTIWIPTRHATLNYLENHIGLWFDGDNEIMFYASDVVGATPNWNARCRKAVAETTVDTGIAISAALQVFKIEVIDFATVKFYINGVEVAEINTNIPTGVEMEPKFELTTRSANTRHFSLKYFSILAHRPLYV